MAIFAVAIFLYDRDRDPPDSAVADCEVVPLRGGWAMPALCGYVNPIGVAVAGHR